MWPHFCSWKRLASKKISLGFDGSHQYQQNPHEFTLCQFFFDFFLLVFWKKWRYQKFISQLTDLYLSYKSEVILNQGNIFELNCSLTLYWLKQRTLWKIFEEGFPVFILYFLQTSFIFCLLNSKIASEFVDSLFEGFGGKKIKSLKLELFL